MGKNNPENAKFMPSRWNIGLNLQIFLQYLKMRKLVQKYSQIPVLRCEIQVQKWENQVQWCERSIKYENQALNRENQFRKCEN